MTRHENIQKAMADMAQGFVLQYLLAQHFKSSPDPVRSSSSFLNLCETVAEKMT
jgi:hypothetical protein